MDNRYNGMDKPISSIILFVFYLLLFSTASATTPLIKGDNYYINFKNLGRDEGIPQSRVNCTVNDKIRGILWIGSDKGLSYYDGYKIQKPKLIGFENSSSIQECVIDEKGNIYFNLNHEDILIYPVTDSIPKLIKNSEMFKKRKYLYGFSVLNNGTIIAALNNGLGIINLKSLTTTVKYEEKIKGRNISIYGENAYISSETGLYGYNITTEKLTELMIEKNYFYSVLASEKYVYAGTYNNGVIKYNRKEKTFESFDLKTNELVTNINKIRAQLFISVFNEGLYITDENGKVTSTTTEHNSNISTKNIDKVNFNKSNEIITLSTRKGISLANLTDFDIYNYSKINNVIPDDYIWSFAETANSLWVGTGSGILLINKADRKGKIYSKENKNNFAEAVWKVHVDQVGDVWIGTSNGLGKYSKENDSFYSVELKVGNTLLIPEILDIQNGNGTSLWLGTYSHGLLKYMSGKDITQYNDSANDIYKLNSNSIISILPVTNGLWLGTGTTGAIFMPNNFDGFKYFKTKSEGGPFGHRFVRHIFKASNGKIYFGNDSGLYELNGNTIAEIKEMEGKRIYCIANSLAGGLLLGTGNGLIHWRLGYKTKILKKNDGLINDEYNGRACLNLYNKEFAFGGVNGFSIFDSVWLKNRDKNNNPTLILLDSKLAPVDSISIPKDKSTLSLSISNQLFIPNLDMQYAYKVNEKTITDINHTPLTIDIDNIKNGVTKLDILIKTINQNAWTIGRQIYIRRDLFWWQTWLGIIFIAFFCIAALFILHSFRIKKLLTKQVELENAIANRTIQLDKILREKESLFENISHEFRTPLTVIMGKVEKLLAREPNDDLLAVERQSNRLYQLVEKLLKLAEIRAVELNDVATNLHTSMNNSIAALKPLADDKHIQLLMSLDCDNQCYYQLKEDTIPLLIANLLGNAIKFSPEHSAIKIDLCLTGNQELVISVADQGPGFDDPDKALERFRHSKDGNHGSGLGLAIVNEIVTANQGTLTIENLAEGGARLSARLRTRLAEAPQSTALETHNMQVSVKSGLQTKPKLLIAEDEPSLRSHLVDVLAGDFEVEIVTNGAEALAKLGEGTLPDLVLSDVMMPEMSGFELCQQIKNSEEYAHIPVVLLTAKADLDSQKQGLAEFADDYITKPFSSDLLVMKLANIYRTRQAYKKQLLDSVLSTRPLAETASPVESLAQKIQTLLAENYSNEQYAIKQMAEALAVSEKTLNRRLQAIFGQKFSAVLRDYRLERAYEMLKHSNIVQNVAYDVGFSSPAYFSKCFKQRFGIKPSELS